MKKNMIFLSYRRADSPGYVSKLEDELERAFGDGQVFRDATDIRGGTKWKRVIEDNLRASAALLLIIGPRWEEIWTARQSDAVNYVAWELQQAHDLGVAVIPVTLDGVTLSNDIELGEIDWLLENQFHDISDRQGRWAGDFGRLVSLLEGIDGIGAARRDGGAPTDTGGVMTPLKWLGVGVLLTLAALAWFGFNAKDAVVAPLPQAQDTSAAVETEPMQVPDIRGSWRGQDGTIYHVSQGEAGAVAIESPGYASGQGQFSRKRPRLFTFELLGVGRGEFAVSTGGKKMMGYVVVDGQQQFDTLVRVE